MLSKLRKIIIQKIGKKNYSEKTTMKINYSEKQKKKNYSKKHNKAKLLRKTEKNSQKS